MVGIADSTGAAVVAYSYNAWGNLLSISGTLASTLGLLNPLRYRGYVYDAETALYYLQSRYYAPEMGRFINADAFVSPGQGFSGNNMFAYCGNEPVIRVDAYGCYWNHMTSKCLSCGSSYTEISPYASYGDNIGNVYIINEGQLSEVERITNPSDVIIIDYRNSSDPDMQVINSYKIRKRKYKVEIAQIILSYNEENPVEAKWDRSLESIVEEWSIHNIVYHVGIARSRTADTDLNNADEGKGFFDFVQRYFEK